MAEILYKFKKLDKFAIDILVNKRLYLSNWDELNDPHEAQMIVPQGDIKIVANPKRLYEIEETFFTKNKLPKRVLHPRVCSLSSSWSSNLLWSHYAEGHTGIAIGIDSDSIPKNITRIPIIYNDEIPSILHYPLSKNDVIKALSYKSKEWEYENEIRLVTYNKKKYIEGIRIKEICFGQRMDRDEYKIVYSVLHSENVKYYVICQKSGFYALNKSSIPTKSQFTTNN